MQCLYNKLNKLDVILSEVQPLILLVTEHWQSQEQLNCIKLSNYKLSASFCREKQKHGGSAIFVKSGVPVRNLPLFQMRSITNTVECCAIELLQYSLVVVVLYRPPKREFISFLNFLY